eukprot:275293-Pleurochrysis_carterae.AAC.1
MPCASRSAKHGAALEIPAVVSSGAPSASLIGPSCPNALDPHAHTLPSGCTASECERPAARETAPVGSHDDGSARIVGQRGSSPVSCPASFFPHPHTRAGDD